MQLPADYPLAVLSALGMSWQMWAFGAQVAKARKTIFNEDYMIKEWGVPHKNQVGGEVQEGGCPDTGSGMYSQRLSYR